MRWPWSRSPLVQPSGARTSRAPITGKPRNARQQLGRRSEQLAARHLVSQGYTILDTNVRFPVGEIDLIAQDGQTLCFVEVRSTTTDQFGGALASITDRKRRHLIGAAQWYLQRIKRMPPEIRFDVVAIDWRADGEPSVEVVQGAFTGDDA